MDSNTTEQQTQTSVTSPTVEDTDTVEQQEEVTGVTAEQLASAKFTISIDGKQHQIDESITVKVLLDNVAIDELNLEACMLEIVKKLKANYIGMQLDELDIVKHPIIDEVEKLGPAFFCSAMFTPFSARLEINAK